MCSLCAPGWRASRDNSGDSCQASEERHTDDNDGYQAALRCLGEDFLRDVSGRGRGPCWTLFSSTGSMRRLAPPLAHGVLLPQVGGNHNLYEAPPTNIRNSAEAGRGLVLWSLVGGARMATENDEGLREAQAASWRRLTSLACTPNRVLWYRHAAPGEHHRRGP